jgi:LPXTG-motif cell wall-anchored protein
LLIVAAGEMPNTGETGYNVRVIVFMTLLLIGTLLIFWKYKLQEVPSEQD